MREQVAAKIRWGWIIWVMGFVNVTAQLPQLWTILQTQKTDTLAVEMFWIYFSVQVAFSLEGYFKRNKVLMWCLGLSACVTIANIFLIYYYR